MADKRKDNEIRLENSCLLKLSKEVMRMAVNDPELLNAVYKEVSEKLGMDTAMEIYQMFKGQQITFPMRFFNPARIQKCILQEFDTEPYCKYREHKKSPLFYAPNLYLPTHFTG